MRTSQSRLVTRLRVGAPRSRDPNAEGNARGRSTGLTVYATVGWSEDRAPAVGKRTSSTLRDWRCTTNGHRSAAKKLQCVLRIW